MRRRGVIRLARVSTWEAGSKRTSQMLLAEPLLGMTVVGYFEINFHASLTK